MVARVGDFDGIIDAIWRDFHGRHHAVPLCHAVKRESDLQPDVVGQYFQSADAEHYVGNRADIFAHCVALHSLELLQNVGRMTTETLRRNENELY